MNTKSEVKALWEICFDDSKDFVDFYFENRYTDEINLCIRRNDKVVSALQMIPYDMEFCDEIVPIRYISGACTHPDYRGQGLMRELLRQAHRRMREEKVLFSTLIPANKSLFQYYANSGYTDVFGYDVINMVDIDVPSLHVKHFDIERVSCTEEVYEYMQMALLRKRNHVLHSWEDFKFIVADLEMSGGCVLALRRRGKIRALAFVGYKDNELVVKEMLYDHRALIPPLMAKIAGIYKTFSIKWIYDRCFAPYTLGMLRVIDMERAYSIYTNKYPYDCFEFRIEDDSDIPENNGRYYVFQKNVIHDNKPLEHKMFFSKIWKLKDISSFLFNEMHPYMSLMSD